MHRPAIICVDDEPAVLASLAVELKQALGQECWIETAVGGEQALRLFQALREQGYEIAIVLSDYGMPGLKGDELLATIHSLSPHTLNIMLSEQVDLAVVSNALRQAKLYRYIAKPWQTEDLTNSVLAALHSFLQTRQREVQIEQLSRRNQELQQEINTLEQAQQTILEKQQYYEQITEFNSAIFYIYDLNQQQNVYVNHELTNILGYSTAEIQAMGAHFLPSLVHPEDLPRLLAGMERFKQMGDTEVLETEYRIRDVRGEWHWFYSRDRIFSRNPDGSPRQSLGTAMDITAQKRAELEILQLNSQLEQRVQARTAALQASQSRFAGMVEIASDAIISIDAQQRITLFNRGAEAIFGYTAMEVLGQPLDLLLPQRYSILHSHYIEQFAHSSQLSRRMGERSEVYGRRRDGSEFPAEASISRLDLEGELVYTVILRDISDRKQIELTLSQQAERERLIADMTRHIHQSLELETILRTTVTEVRQLFQADRVMVYRFLPDWSGTIDVESVVEPWPTVLGSTLKDHCFAEGYIDRYRQGRIQQVADIFQAGLADCHVDFLSHFQVRANLVVPILQDEQLWGLLIAQQCSAPRQWQPWEVALLQQLATQAGIAIQQSQLYQQTRQQAQREEALNRVIQAIRQSLDLKTIFNTAAAEIGKLLGIDQVFIVQYLAEQMAWVHVAQYRADQRLPVTLGLRIPEADNPLSDRLKQLEVVRVNTTFDLSDPINSQLAETFPGHWLLVPLKVNQTLWGSVTLTHHQAGFSWDDTELDLLYAITDQLAIAIQQSQLYERTRKQADREQALNRVMQSIRQTLDLQAIFTTAVTEIGQLLHADRAEIVQYLPEQRLWQHLAEYCCSPDLPSTVGLEIADENNPLAEQLKRLQIVRIQNAQACEDPINRSLAERLPGAWLLMPLQVNGQIWGSLSLIRNMPGQGWHSEEVTLVYTMADQLAIAIQQVKAFEQTQQELRERQRAEIELQNSLKEKISLLQEVHHRVKNNLQVISSLLLLQSRRVDHPQARAILEDSQNRVMAMSLVHQNLYQTHNFAQVGFAEYVRTLTNYLFQSLNVQSEQVTLHTEIDSTAIVPLEKAVPCGLILNELITNALKHGFYAEDQRGDLWINLVVNDNDSLTLRVANNGNPLPTNFSLESSESLGLKLVKVLSEQLNAILEINAEGPTVFSITFNPAADLE
uniref:histidine kinase n=1 Tax=Cyanothece sp. (strain PCC 7425 / ATCC 29141) TaxID=395961 RepID=B8HTH3_CYAP4